MLNTGHTVKGLTIASITYLCIFILFFLQLAHLSYHIDLHDAILYSDETTQFQAGIYKYTM